MNDDVYEISQDEHTNFKPTQTVLILFKHTLIWLLFAMVINIQQQDKYKGKKYKRTMQIVDIWFNTHETFHELPSSGQKIGKPNNLNVFKS